MDDFSALLALVPGALAADIGLRALRRRQRASALRPGGRRRAASLAGAAIAALRVVLWGVVAWTVLGMVPVLRPWRDLFPVVAQMSLTAPLVPIGDRQSSVLHLLALPAILVLVWILVGWSVRRLVTRAQRLAGFDRGVSDAAMRVGRVLAAGLLGLLVVQAWGFDVRSFALLASVLGVGIGFGLQNLASNFVSGLVVGFERPIQVGDFVQVGEWEGTVERIGARSTVITTLDRVTVLVPNSRFLEHEVVNWSHGDPVYRLHVPVSVAYGSDVPRVRRALLEVAAAHPGVLATPAPKVEFKKFGESSLDFVLLVWAGNPRIQHRLHSDLNFRIDAAFRQSAIRIPFPQRDLHVRTPDLAAALASLGAAPAEPAPAAGADEPCLEEDGVGPELWGRARLVEVAARLRGPGGVRVADRRYGLGLHAACFVGREAIDWLVRSLGLTRDEGVVLGRMLVAHGLVSHVLGERDFEDGNLYYRFLDEEVAIDGTPVAAASMHDGVMS